MKHVFNFFLILIFLGNTLDSGNDPVNIDEIAIKFEEGQVIKILFDSVQIDELDIDKFGVIHFWAENIEFVHGDILAWFRYNFENEYIILNYYFFPSYEIFSEQHNKNASQLKVEKMNQFKTFMKEIIEHKKLIDTEKIKQLKISSPVGLKNDILFHEMQKIYKCNPLIIELGHVPIYNWGLKSDKIEFIRNYSSYVSNPEFRNQIETKILYPIKRAVLEHETPKHWKEDFENWKNEYQMKN